MTQHDQDDVAAVPQEAGGAGAPEQMQVRLAKVARLRAAGIDPYPVGYPRTHVIADVRAQFGSLPADTYTGVSVGVAGRVILYRNGGKLCFARLRDGSGEMQVMVRLDKVGEQALSAWKTDVDLGDHVGVTGEVITSRSGELSVLADSFAITAKALRPLPDKHRGLTDPESRVRQRYLDLIVNPEARRSAEVRAAVTRAVREELHDRGFLEAETPVLQTLHGGRTPGPLPPISTPSGSTCTCGSPWSSTSSGSSWAASSGSTKSAASSGTRVSTRRTTPSSRCSRCTRPTPTTTPCRR